MEHKKVTSRNGNKFYETHISKILKNISDNGITNNSRQQLNSMLYMISEIIANISIYMTIKANKKNTICDRCTKCARNYIT